MKKNDMILYAGAAIAAYYIWQHIDKIATGIQELGSLGTYKDAAYETSFATKQNPKINNRGGLVMV